MVLPTLSKNTYEALNVSFGDKLVSPAEFKGILNDCLSLYRTKPGMQRANLLTHLMNYDPPEGLRLATAEIMIQGDDQGGDVLRMANNIIKLKRAQMKVQEEQQKQQQLDVKKKELQVLTMSLDDFISNPALSMTQFFEFVLPPDVSRERMHEVAVKYEQFYHEKRKKSRHVTHGKSEDSAQLMEYLRHDPVFGRVLSKIALLVETVLMDSQSV